MTSFVQIKKPFRASIRKDFSFNVKLIGRYSSPALEIIEAPVTPAKPEELSQAYGVIFGSPTRYGNMIAQMKSLIDATAGLWLKGEMEGKPAGLFTSTATTHVGQDSTFLTIMAPLLHLGMMIVGVPYSTPGMLQDVAALPTERARWLEGRTISNQRPRIWKSPGSWGNVWRRRR